MDLRADLDTTASPEQVFVHVERLDTYPQWLDIVPRAEVAPAHAQDPGPAWFVTLRAKVGPLARSKRLRMVRTVHDPDARVVFERLEHDGKEHATWRLTASVLDRPGGARLDMSLHYSGALWVPLLDRVLRQEIEGSRPRLQRLIAAS